ncbi:MAG: hypothetical protein PUF77_08570 [Clostridiales bacterium]|nr:hypothetical protein [Clostridiales bacterium]
MIVGSTLFVFIFLPITLLLYYLIPKRFRGARNGLLLAVSLVFYAFGEPLGVIILLVSIVAAYLFAGSITLHNRRGHKGAAAKSMIMSVAFQLLIVFGAVIIPALLDYAGTAKIHTFPFNRLIYPIGITFYSLQIIVFQLDIYNEDARLRKGFVNYALSVAFFGKILYGPVVEYDSIAKQIQQRKESLVLFGQGITAFIGSLVLKVVLADRLGDIWKVALAESEGRMSAVTAWIGGIYSLLYFTAVFTAYTGMAEGLGLMFGIELPKSFRKPLSSKSVTEFWRRFHITFTDCFRKLVYMPLGGDGNLTAFVLVALVITCVFAGLSLGVKVGFVIFGVYTALVIFLEKKVWGRLLKKLPGFIRRVYTWILTSIGFAIFGSAASGQSLGYLKAMFGFNRVLADSSALYLLQVGALTAVLVVMCSGRVFDQIRNRLLSKGLFGEIVVAVCYVFLLIAVAASMVSRTVPDIRFMIL